MKRSLGKQIFFSSIFGTFGRYETNLRGTFVENAKKVQNQPTHWPIPTVAAFLNITNQFFVLKLNLFLKPKMSSRDQPVYNSKIYQHSIPNITQMLKKVG
jgi:hypothetical protein